MIRTTALLMLAGAATANAGGIFSFASDFSDQSWTFTGSGHGGHFAMVDGTPNTDQMTLLIDDGNGGLDPLAIEADFNFHTHFEYLSSTSIGGGKFLHAYSMDSTSAGWYTANGPVLEMTFEGALFTIVGSEFGWDSAGSIFGADSWADVQYTSYIDAPDYGMYVGDSVGPQDFAFTLTALNSSGVIPYDFSSPGAHLDPNTMLPEHEFFAEGSFSGSAQFVPTPGTASLLLGAGLIGLRRRR